MECAVHYIQLLFAGQLDEVYCVAGNSDGQLRVFFRMFHGIQQRFTHQHIHIQVVPVVEEVTIQQCNQIVDLFFIASAQCVRNDAERVADAVFRLIVGQFGN